MFDKATGRVVAVIVLLIVIAASLRGYLPGADRATRKSPPDSGASLVYVIAMLSVSLVILAVAVIVRLRDPRRVAPSAGGLPDRFSDGRGRPTWRVLAIGAAVLAAWLLAVWLLSQFVVPHTAGQPPTAPRSTAPTPASNVSRPPQPRDVGGDRDMLRYLIAMTVALLALAVVGAVVAARRRRVQEPPIVAAEMPRPAPTPDTSGRWRGLPKSGWPKSGTAAANRGRRSSRVMRRWNANWRMSPEPSRRISIPLPRCWPEPSKTMRCVVTAPASW